MTSMAIIIFIILIVLVVSILILFNKKTTTVSKSINIVTSVETKKKEIPDVPMPNTFRLFLPPHIESLAKTEVLDVVKKVYEVYKVFDYKSMDMNELDKKEWHTWQISFLLMLFKRSEEFFIPNQESFFHPFLLKATENDIKNFMRSIVKKYENYVNIKKTKDVLCKEHIWTNRDVSIMFYFLANYKKYKK